MTKLNEMFVLILIRNLGKSILSKKLIIILIFQH